MRGIAGEQHPPLAIAFGNHEMRRPGIGNQNLVRKIPSGKSAQQCGYVDVLRRHLLRPARLQGPDIFVVLRDQGARGGLVVPGNPPALEQVDIGRAEMGQEALLHSPLALEPDADAIANPAGPPVATDQIAAADLLSRPISRSKRCDHLILVLREVLQFHAPPRVDHRGRLHRALQDRLDLHLRDAHRRLRGHAAVVARADQRPPVGHARIAEPVQLMPGQMSDPGHIEIAGLRHGDRPQRIDHAKPTEQLHAAGIGDVHLGMARGRRVAFDQQARDAAP